MASSRVIKMKCVLCNGVLDDAHGHNAQPLADGRCCTFCNDTKVIPARLARAMEGKPLRTVD